MTLWLIIMVVNLSQRMFPLPVVLCSIKGPGGIKAVTRATLMVFIITEYTPVLIAFGGMDS